MSAYDGDGQVRTGAWVADITGVLDMEWRTGRRGCGSSSAKGARTPGAQLQSTDIDGHRFTVSPPAQRRGSSPTSSSGTVAVPAVRTGSGTPRTPGCATSPERLAQNQVWCEIVVLACELLASMQMLALAGEARRWEPKWLRLRVFAAVGRLAYGGRRLRFAERWPWAANIAAAVTRLQALPAG